MNREEIVKVYEFVKSHLTDNELNRIKRYDYTVLNNISADKTNKNVLEDAIIRIILNSSEK